MLAAGCLGSDPTSEATSALHKDKCKVGKTKKKCVVTTAVVGVQGGTVETEDGVSLSVPFGALAEPTELTITTSTLEIDGALSPVYVFEPDGAVFARPLTVTLPHPSAEPASVYWSRLGEPGFDAIGGTVANGTITATTGHFSQAYVGPKSTTRAVTGVYVRTWISASSRVDEKLDFGTNLVEALVDNGTSYTAIAGKGGATGTFKINGVPDGEYVLHARDNLQDVYVVSATNTPDLGTSFGGRPFSQRLPLVSPTALNLDISNMIPWSASDQIELFATEADDWHFRLHFYAPSLDLGHTSTTVNFEMLDSGNPLFGTSAIDGTAGDRVIIAQLAERTSANGATYKALSRMKQLPAFDLFDGGSYSTSVALDDVSLGNTIAMDWRGNDTVDALSVDKHPASHNTCIICGGHAYVLGQAGFARDGFYTSNADLIIFEDQSPSGTNTMTGAMTYGSTSSLPGQWGELFASQYTWRNLVRLPDTSPPAQLFFTGYGYTTSVETGANAVLTPLITQPRSITVDGVDAFTGSTTLSATPTISWLPPRIGTADVYVITVHELFVDANNQTQRGGGTTIFTPHTSFRLPAGIIDATKSYVFRVEARTGTTAEAKAALAAAPRRALLDTAGAEVLTSIFGNARGTP